MNDPAPKPTSLRAIRDAVQKVAVALVAANDGKPHVIHPQVTAEAVAALALLEGIVLGECRPNPETQAVAPNVQEVQHNDELMGKIFNITRSADSLDSSWLGKVRAAINEYIKGSAK